MPLLNTPILFLATSDAERCRDFYESTLGLTFVADQAWALVFDVGGIMLRIQKVDALPEVKHTAAGWRVDDMEAAVETLVGQGVVFERFPGMPQDDKGVWQTPDGAKVAWFKDPDGNTLSLTQHDD